MEATVKQGHRSCCCCCCWWVDNCLFRKTNRMPEMFVVVVDVNWSIFQKMNWKKLVVAVVGIRSVVQKRNKKQKVVNDVGVVALQTAHGGAPQRRKLVAQSQWWWHSLNFSIHLLIQSSIFLLHSLSQSLIICSHNLLVSSTFFLDSSSLSPRSLSCFCSFFNLYGLASFKSLLRVRFAFMAADCRDFLDRPTPSHVFSPTLSTVR